MTTPNIPADKPQTVGGAVGSIVDGVKGIVDAVKYHAPKKVAATDPGDELEDNAPYKSPASYRGDELVTDTGISSQTGYVGMAGVQMPPDGALTRAARAIAGVLPSPITQFRGLDMAN